MTYPAMRTVACGAIRGRCLGLEYVEFVAAVVQHCHRFLQLGAWGVGLVLFALSECLPAAAADQRTGHSLLGKPAPELVQHLFTGPSRNFRLSERRGEVVVLGFWTSWCGSCRAYLERLAKLDATYGSAGLVVVGVSLDDNPVPPVELARAVGVRFRNALDAEKTLGRRFDVADVPLTLLIDRGGVVRYVHGELGPAGEADLLVELRQLLDE
jgi:thiol-disulfide isomerase/thioredoxin